MLPARYVQVQIEDHAGFPVPDFPRIQKIVKRISNASAPGRMLDVGYSKGSFADYLAEAGWACTGLDLSEHNHPAVRTICCDLNDPFPVASGEFDLVAAGEVLEHVIDQEFFLQECGRVLRPGGLLVLTTPNLSYLLNRFLVPLGAVPMFVHARYHYHFHTKKTLESLVSECGFRIDKLLSSHTLYSSRRHSSGRIFEYLGDLFPTLGAHLILFASKAC